MIWEFSTMPLVSFRELLWWVAPFIQYRRFPKLIRFDQFSLEAKKKDMDVMLHSAWLSLDLWKSLTFFCERPYPKEVKSDKR